MSIFIFIQLAFGFQIALRTLQYFSERKIFSNMVLTKIGTAYFLSICALIFCLRLSPFLLWNMLFLPIGILFFSRQLVGQIRMRKFRQDFLLLLNHVMLLMKSGRSWMESMELANQSLHPFSQVKMQELLRAVVFSAQKPIFKEIFLNEIYFELKQIHQSPHMSIRRLQSLRNKLQMQENFRRKSGQALHQVKAQVVLMSFLYFALLIFTVVQFGWRTYRSLYGVSLILFLVGILITYSMGKKIKWSV
jgi:hypothetical protein